MTREELNANIDFLFNDQAPIGIKLFFIVEPDGTEQVRLADISNEAATDLRNLFLEGLRRKLVNNPELDYGPISEAAETNNAAYFYDLGEIPDSLSIMCDVDNEDVFALNMDGGEPPFQTFSFIRGDFSGLKGFVICLGNEAHKVTLYKKLYPVSVLRQGSFLTFFPRDNRLERMGENAIKMNDKTEFMLVNGELIVLDIKTFQNSFGYDKIIKDKATENIGIIVALGIIEDVDGLRELAQELKFAKRIMRIRHHSPVLQVPFPTIANFIRNHPKLKRRLKLNDAGTQFKLDTRTSKELLIKLLNDDYLKSELTELLYDSQTKNALDQVEAEED
jgi:hypothetical protein